MRLRGAGWRHEHRDDFAVVGDIHGLANLHLPEHGAAVVAVISAGSSAGARDSTAQAVATLGKPDIFCHGLAVKPGKPILLAECEGVPVIGVPGNPLPALGVVRLLGAPLVWRLAGRATPPPEPSVTAVLTRADGYLVVPESAIGLDAGAPVPVTLYREPVGSLSVTILLQQVSVANATCMAYRQAARPRRVKAGDQHRKGEDMRVSGVFAMGGVRENSGGGYGPYYPDNGRWTYYYYQGNGYVGHFGYGETRSRGLIGVGGGVGA